MTAARDRFPVKRLPDGRALVNLGSSARCAPGWNNVDFGWLIRLGRHRTLCALLRRAGLLSEARHARILSLDPDAVLWDLRKGIPFADGTFDGVYHCHVLEHIDREDAPAFMAECLRVLKPGGVLRVVVPDLEALARKYLAIVDREAGEGRAGAHAAAVGAMIDQMVPRVPRERSGRGALVRTIENLLVGDTSKSGALHRWMYDRHSLSGLMADAGFTGIRGCGATTSRIGGWAGFHLDTEPDGTVYKPDSLYMEGVR
jgi:SAM-dependent methyltransferase